MCEQQNVMDQAFTRKTPELEDALAEQGIRLGIDIDKVFG